MKKLKKSVKIVLISCVSVVCVLAVVLGCVFGLKNDEPTPEPAPSETVNLNDAQQNFFDYVNSKQEEPQETEELLADEIYESALAAAGVNENLFGTEAKRGESYIFISNPNGYSTTSLVYFTLNESGEVQNSYLLDEFVSITFGLPESIDFLSIYNNLIEYKYEYNFEGTDYVVFAVSNIANVSDGVNASEVLFVRAEIENEKYIVVETGSAYESTEFLNNENLQITEYDDIIFSIEDYYIYIFFTQEDEFGEVENYNFAFVEYDSFSEPIVYDAVTTDTIKLEILDSQGYSDEYLGSELDFNDYYLVFMDYGEYNIIRYEYDDENNLTSYLAMPSEIVVEGVDYHDFEIIALCDEYFVFQYTEYQYTENYVTEQVASYFGISYIELDDSWWGGTVYSVLSVEYSVPEGSSSTDYVITSIDIAEGFENNITDVFDILYGKDYDYEVKYQDGEFYIYFTNEMNEIVLTILTPNEEEADSGASQGEEIQEEENQTEGGEVTEVVESQMSNCVSITNSSFATSITFVDGLVINFVYNFDLEYVSILFDENCFYIYNTTLNNDDDDSTYGNYVYFYYYSNDEHANVSFFESKQDATYSYKLIDGVFFVECADIASEEEIIVTSIFDEDQNYLNYYYGYYDASEGAFLDISLSEGFSKAEIYSFGGGYIYLYEFAANEEHELETTGNITYYYVSDEGEYTQVASHEASSAEAVLESYADFVATSSDGEFDVTGNVVLLEKRVD